MKESISTEGRIFARVLSREIKRREAIGANAMFKGDTTWVHAAYHLMDEVFNAPGPGKAVKVMDAVYARMKRISPDDKSFLYPPGSISRFSNRQACWTVYTMEYGPHPIVKNETGILIRRHYYYSSRKVINTRTNDELAFVSDHTLGRLHDRSEEGKWNSPGYIIGLAGILGLAGEIGHCMAHHYNDREGTQLNLAVSDVTLTGTMRHVMKTDKNGDGHFQPFFDVRTSLPDCSVEQRRQALAVSTLITHAVKLDTSVMVLMNDPEVMKQIPYLQKREDYISSKMKMERVA